ncbi:MAG: 16S rRNA (guanine(527)-N(7))-methyltransferase RsmG [Rhizobiales bacterium]|nr:16S rRNA (guanine(527)-N(7))-methyltransferase RsmG [Hyphomicrobiales bacterium]MBO6699510.1 16S rRNA (guanine(527)-N(7))-methyltransferase RsmG [Hyphomicrobiales bacterium]MBO6737048.1 16S rRNA (guanine(527)-N(7))-methyltransferase RsmG [Hyphomicrobiales bacterium]MBO6911878.1 16S rRNA (guanine(527)-N(7))-methyltransferase RsmG [Hyphomicrobiales bacterium]MBO6954814.1 16S rRNA (guanine(527)-N(7))-methyltransferase RsmG [Hyphomicrobiales bacterium]
MDDRFGLETAERLTGVVLGVDGKSNLLRFVDLLRSWQQAKNLVSRETLDQVWERHIADGLQLFPLIERWAESNSDDLAASRRGPIQVMDLGSGAGLPGLVFALARPDNPSGNGASDNKGAGSSHCFDVSLVEANGRKASFLRTVSRETGVPVTVINTRIDAVHGDPSLSPDIITARALAPLPKLMGLADPWMAKGATAFFHKGGEYARELAEWTDASRHDVVEHVSVVDPSSRILQVTRKDAQRPRQTP